MRNHRTDEGAELGRMMAKWCDDAEPAARLHCPELPPRCNSCAFRPGPHIANGSPATQMDALKCVLEGVEFQCHEPARIGTPCSGWAMFMLGDKFDFLNVPWRFSDESGSDPMTKGWPAEFEAVEAEQWGSETPPDPRVVLDQLAQTPEAAGLHEVAAYSVAREPRVVALLVVLGAIVAAIGAVVIVMALS